MSEHRFNQDEVYSIRNAVGEAFAMLREQGFIARVNFSCCTGCASYELSEMARTRKNDRAVFWHRQDDESFRKGYPLHIRYFYLAPEGDDSDTTAEEQAIGEQVAAALKEQHLQIEWDGDPHYTIQVTGLNP